LDRKTVKRNAAIVSFANVLGSIAQTMLSMLAEMNLMWYSSGCAHAVLPRVGARDFAIVGV